MRTSVTQSITTFTKLENHKRTSRQTALRLCVLIGSVFLLIGVVSSSSRTTSSASSAPKVSPARVSFENHVKSVESYLNIDRGVSPILIKPISSPVFFQPPQGPTESLITYAADCTTPKSTFVVGDIVCVKASGFNIDSDFPRRIAWSTTDSSVIVGTELTSEGQTDSLLITATTNVNGTTVDNRGTWKIGVRNPFFYYPEATVKFTVSDPANAASDLGVTATFSSDSVQSGSQTSYGLQVDNYGPDTATNVTLTDAVASGTLVSLTQLSGPTFNCSTPGNCTIAALNAGDKASFLATVQATVQASSGTDVTNTADVSSAAADIHDKNNSISVSTSITPDNGSPCTITCPANIVADNDAGTGGHTIPAANFPQPNAAGTCGSVSLSVQPNPQTNDYFFPIGTTFVTAEAETGDTCTFTVTISDNENPTVSCPADLTTFESPAGSGFKTVNYNVTADDNSGSATVDCGPHPSGSSFPVGTTGVVCTATDGAGNTSTSCTFNVTVEAVTSTCVLTTQPPIVVNTDANACGTHVTYTTPTSDGTGSCGTVTCDHPSGSFFGEGETLVTCTSNPDGGTTSFTVTVNDTTAPVPDLASLPTITKDCTANAGIPTTIITPNGPRVVFEPPTATDNCGGHISGSTDDPRVYQDPGTFTVHWTYTDPNGNTSAQNQTIVVTGSDVTAPVPDVATLPTVTDECSATVTTTPTATDDCDGTLTGTTSDPLTYTGAGTYTVHWTYTDQAGHAVNQNQTVAVTDVHAPTIALEGAASITVECHTSFSDPGVTTTDNCVPKNVNVATTGSLNINVPGTYTLTYTATDGGGNQASVQRTVIVQDTTPPVVTAPPNVTVYTGPGNTSCTVVVSDATLGAASASDSCQGSLPTTRNPPGNVFPVGVTTITYSATDASNNTGTATQTVTVIDNTSPTITCATNIVADFNPAVNGAIVTYTTPVGNDNCSGATTTQTAGLPSGSTFPSGTTTNTFRVTDAAGNTAECSFKVTVALTSIIGLDSVSVIGSGLVDSYTSSGGYPATKSSLANVLSNGTITFTNSGKVAGNVRSTRAGVVMSGATLVTGNATAGTTVSRSGSAVVGGTITNNVLAPFMTLPAVPTCGPPYSPNSGISGSYSYNAATGDLNLTGVNIATLANGTYCFHNVTLTNSAQLKVNGPVVIKLTGTLNAGGATSLTNTTANPTNLRILSSFTGANGVAFTNSTNVHLIVYAPNTAVTVSGAVPLFGTVVGKTVTVSNSGMIHYDLLLISSWPDVWTNILGP